MTNFCQYPRKNQCGRVLAKIGNGKIKSKRLIFKASNVPVDKLEDLYSIIRSLRVNTKKSDKTTKKILSFVGSFGDMAEKDYKEFVQQTKSTRNDLFDRAIPL